MIEKAYESWDDLFFKHVNSLSVSHARWNLCIFVQASYTTFQFARRKQTNWNRQTQIFRFLKKIDKMQKIYRTSIKIGQKIPEISIGVQNLQFCTAMIQETVASFKYSTIMVDKVNIFDGKSAMYDSYPRQYLKNRINRKKQIYAFL